jgi:xanthine dehydrogenase YagR molybdenum-binding subunit
VKARDGGGGPHVRSCHQLGARGFGETAGTGVPAAISNAIFHATGRRLRDVPFTQDKLL